MGMKVLDIIVLISLLIFSAGCNEIPQNELTLFDSESDSELDQIHWKCHTLMSLSDQHVTHGKKSLKLELFPSQYPGFTPALKHHNWEKYRAFRFDIYNQADNDVPITLRVDDKEDSNDYSDRYNETFFLKPGMNQLVIPLDSLTTTGTNRSLNLENIYQFLLFAVDPPEKVVLYLDYIRLVR